MHRTDSRSRTVIPSTNSKSRAVIPTQKEPSAKSESEPRATNKPRAIYKSRAMMPSTNSKLRTINLNSNTERIDLKQDLQIASCSNRQSIDLRNKHALCLRRTLRPTFKV